MKPVTPSQHVPVIFGTAGHIDHGKSSLVQALTGTDPDRFKEEKERGITIDLGFAFLSPSIALIDVPGHERFIKNMVAGAATVDFAILVIAADDGVMPQTREHVEILELLGVKSGMVALTKKDKVDEDWLDLVQEDVKEYLESTVFADAPLYVCDSLSGDGIEAIRSALFDLAAQKQQAGTGNHFYMPVDRVFSVKGHGTVVTGSVLSGQVRPEDNVGLLPWGRTLRVRRLQSQGREIPQVVAGNRAALNLADVDVEDISRGMVLATPDVFQASRYLDVKLHALSSFGKPLLHRQRMRVHAGTAEVMARLAMMDGERIDPGQDGFVQLILESPLALRRGERFVIRQYSPLRTIGGGEVLNPNPEKHKRNRPEVLDRLKQLAEGTLAGWIVQRVDQATSLRLDELAGLLDQTEETLQTDVDALVEDGRLVRLETGNRVASGAIFAAWLESASSYLDAFHQKYPLRAGMRRQELLQKTKIAAKGFVSDFMRHGFGNGSLRAVGTDLVALPTFEINLTRKEQQMVQRLEQELRNAAFMPPQAKEAAHLVGLPKADALLEYLVYLNRAVCLEGFFFHQENLRSAEQSLARRFSEQERLTVAEIRDLFNTSRKYAVPLVTYFDALGWTKREEDVRIRGEKLSEL